MSTRSTAVVIGSSTLPIAGVSATSVKVLGNRTLSTAQSSTQSGVAPYQGASTRNLRRFEG